MPRSLRRCTLLLSGTLALAAHAQEAPAAAGDQGSPPKTINIKARTKPGDLAYAWVLKYQRLLQSYLPTERRIVDFSWRITFAEFNLAEQDSFTPQGWAAGS